MDAYVADTVIAFAFAFDRMIQDGYACYLVGEDRDGSLLISYLSRLHMRGLAGEFRMQLGEPRGPVNISITNAVPIELVPVPQAPGPEPSPSPMAASMRRSLLSLPESPPPPSSSDLNVTNSTGLGLGLGVRTVGTFSLADSIYLDPNVTILWRTADGRPPENLNAMVPTASANSSMSSGEIIGIVVGSAAALLLLALAFFLIIRARRLHPLNDSWEIHPSDLRLGEAIAMGPHSTVYDAEFRGAQVVVKEFYLLPERRGRPFVGSGTAEGGAASGFFKSKTSSRVRMTRLFGSSRASGDRSIEGTPTATPTAAAGAQEARASLGFSGTRTSDGEAQVEPPSISGAPPPESQREVQPRPRTQPVGWSLERSNRGQQGPPGSNHNEAASPSALASVVIETPLSSPEQLARAGGRLIPQGAGQVRVRRALGLDFETAAVAAARSERPIPSGALDGIDANPRPRADPSSMMALGPPPVRPVPGLLREGRGPASALWDSLGPIGSARPSPARGILKKTSPIDRAPSDSEATGPVDPLLQHRPSDLQQKKVSFRLQSDTTSDATLPSIRRAVPGPVPGARHVSFSDVGFGSVLRTRQDQIRARKLPSIPDESPTPNAPVPMGTGGLFNTRGPFGVPMPASDRRKVGVRLDIQPESEPKPRSLSAGPASRGLEGAAPAAVPLPARLSAIPSADGDSQSSMQKTPVRSLLAIHSDLPSGSLSSPGGAPLSRKQPDSGPGDREAAVHVDSGLGPGASGSLERGAQRLPRQGAEPIASSSGQRQAMPGTYPHVHVAGPVDDVDYGRTQRPTGRSGPPSAAMGPRSNGVELEGDPDPAGPTVKDPVPTFGSVDGHRDVRVSMYARPGPNASTTQSGPAMHTAGMTPGPFRPTDRTPPRPEYADSDSDSCAGLGPAPAPAGSMTEPGPVRRVWTPERRGSLSKPQRTLPLTPSGSPEARSPGWAALPSAGAAAVSSMVRSVGDAAHQLLHSAHGHRRRWFRIQVAFKWPSWIRTRDPDRTPKLGSDLGANNTTDAATGTFTSSSVTIDASEPLKGQAHGPAGQGRGRPAALFGTTLTSATAARALFVQEFCRVFRLRHSRLCLLYGAALVGDGRDTRALVAMEKMEGGTVHALLSNDALPLEADVKLRMCREIAQSLECLHTNEVLHLDLKPSNCLLGFSGEVKCADYGLTASSALHEIEGLLATMAAASAARGAGPVGGDPGPTSPSGLSSPTFSILQCQSPLARHPSLDAERERRTSGSGRLHTFLQRVRPGSSVRARSAVTASDLFVPTSPGPGPTRPLEALAETPTAYGEAEDLSGRHRRLLPTLSVACKPPAGLASSSMGLGDQPDLGLGLGRESGLGVTSRSSVQSTTPTGSEIEAGLGLGLGLGPPSSCAASAASGSTATVTRSLSSLLYAAPELLRGEPPSAASDMYAFGILCWKIFTRAPLYPGISEAEIVARVRDGDLRPPLEAAAQSHAPKDVRDLMAECWSPNPLRRPPATEVVARLTRACEMQLGTNQALYMRRREALAQGGRDRLLLHRMLPAHVAEMLAEGRPVEPQFIASCTIFFSDIVGYTDLAAQLAPREVMDLLHRLYTRFDQITVRHDLFKVETIGDSYMVAGNVHAGQMDHAARVARFALDVREAAAQVRVSKTLEPIQIVSILNRQNDHFENLCERHHVQVSIVFCLSHSQ